MCAQTHYTEKLLRRINELKAEYQELEKLKDSAYKELVEKLEEAQNKIQELESQHVTKDTK